MFWWQLVTLQKIEEEDSMEENVHDQVLFFFLSIFLFFLCVNLQGSMYNGEQQKDIWFLKPTML